MRASVKGAAGAAFLAAAAVVYAPLIAAILGTGFHLNGRAAFRGVASPLAVSAASALVSAVVALLLGTTFAVLVERARPGLRGGCWTLGLLVLMVPPYIAAESWIVLLGPVGKISKAAAIMLGFGPATADPVQLARFTVPGYVYTWAGVGVVMGGCLFPIVALAVASTLRRTDHRIFEAARLAQGARGVCRIAAHLLTPPALGGALLVFAATLTEFAVPQVLRVRTLGEAVYARIQDGELATAAALVLPLLPLVVAAAALGAYLLLRARVASLAGLEGEVPRFSPRAGGRITDLGAGLVSLVAATPALLLSVAALVWLAVTAGSAHASALGRYKVLRAAGLVDSLSGAWQLAHGDAVRTVLLAAVAATLACGFAVLLARLTSRAGWGVLPWILGAGLAVPAPIVGLGLITLWDNHWGAPVYRSAAIILLAWLARFLPLTILLVQGALARVPVELEHAAALAGKGAWGRFTSVILPNAAPGLAAAWLATYVFSATEFSATLLIAPPGCSMLAPSVVNLMRRGQDPEIAACQFLLLCVVALPLAALAVAGLVRARALAIKREAA